jgi:kinetochore protein Mis12/MTW1
MAQVETLLENAVDRNFDAFELYVLRNVFNVPEEVEGYLRLQHHQV